MAWSEDAATAGAQMKRELITRLHRIFEDRAHQQDGAEYWNARFAAALHISPRTLQQWEQGRRHPSGAAETLLKIVSRYPEMLRDVTAGA